MGGAEDSPPYLSQTCCRFAAAHLRTARVTYPDAIQFLRSLQMFGARLGLDIARQLAVAAGNPHDGLKFVHVAGTNGKGSTCAMLEAIYRAAGWRVGLYTSPHLVSFRERMQVNRQLISEREVTRLASEAQQWVKSLGTEPATFFEVVTIMALRYFAGQRCDLVIWETGLGGRLDATNIVTPLASVITNVQFDHERWLGDTLEKIAREKAGIIKARVPVVTAADHPDALAVIRETAANQLAPLQVISADDLSRVPASLALRGEHQRRNAALALRVAALLQDAFPVTDDMSRRALEEVEWPARFQIINRGRQMLVLDGAHNPAGARALVETLRQQFPQRSVALVLGVLEDKNWREVCHCLAPLAHKIITVPVNSVRTADATELAAACREASPRADVRVVNTTGEALSAFGAEPMVVLTGSLYFVGEAMELLGLGAAPGERALNEWTPQATSASG
jgi:dihydrofolate synthase / folylpolyglutamate synthase